MTEQAKKFTEALSADQALQAELSEALKGLENEDRLSQIVAFAKQKGYALTREDLTPEDADLSLSELEAVTGAGYCSCETFGSGCGDGLVCACAEVGSGKVEGHPDWGNCFCMMTGTGSSYGNRH